MSVFHTFYQASNINNNFEQIKKTVIEIMPEIPANILGDRKQVYENTEDTFKIWCEYFSLNIKSGGKTIKYKSKDYGINLHYQFMFDIYTSSSDWLKEILTFVGKLMILFDGDCILESNGEQPLVIRKNESVIVDLNKIGKEYEKTLEDLGIEYMVRDLEIV